MNVSYIKPSFNTPIRHLQNNGTTPLATKACADFIDDYFSWGRQCFRQTANQVNILNGKLIKVVTPASMSRSAGMTAFKIVTYMTIIIPIIMLFAKIIYRARINANYAVEIKNNPPSNSDSSKKDMSTQIPPKKDVDDGRPVFEKCHKHRDNDTLVISCHLPALKWRPEEALIGIYNVLKENANRLPNILSTRFSEGEGMDEGGLSREFITELFAALLKNSKQMHFSQCGQDGLHIPVLTDAQFAQPDQPIESYEALGALFIFLLKCATPRQPNPEFPLEPPERHLECPIGEIFSPAFFKYLTKNSLSESILDINEVLTTDVNILGFLYDYSDLLSQADKGEAVGGKEENWIFKHICTVLGVYSEEDLDQNKDNVEEAIRELNDIWYDDTLDGLCEYPHFDEIKKKVASLAMEPILKRLHAICHIQRGMQSLLPQVLKIEQNTYGRYIINLDFLETPNPHGYVHLQDNRTENLQLALQGRLSKAQLIRQIRPKNNFHHNYHTQNVIRWIHQWINDPATTLDMLRKFVKAVTGSTALAGHIEVETRVPDPKSSHDDFREVKCDTCHMALYVNSLLTQDQFLTALRCVVEGEDTGFSDR